MQRGQAAPRRPDQGSRKLSTGLPRALSDGPNLSCATLESQIRYCSCTGRFSPKTSSICWTSAGGVLSESKGPPGSACIVTKVSPVTTKKTGMNQSRRRMMRRSIVEIRRLGIGDWEIRGAERLRDCGMSTGRPENLQSPNRNLPISQFAIARRPPGIPVHRREGGIGALDIGLGEDREAAMVVGRHAHFLAKHQLFHLGVECLAHFGVGLDRRPAWPSRRPRCIRRVGGSGCRCSGRLRRPSCSHPGSRRPSRAATFRASPRPAHVGAVPARKTGNSCASIWTSTFSVSFHIACSACASASSSELAK
jgi:hypothetical protein